MSAPKSVRTLLKEYRNLSGIAEQAVPTAMGSVPTGPYAQQQQAAAQIARTQAAQSLNAQAQANNQRAASTAGAGGPNNAQQVAQNRHAELQAQRTQPQSAIATGAAQAGAAQPKSTFQGLIPRGYTPPAKTPTGAPRDTFQGIIPRDSGYVKTVAHDPVNFAKGVGDAPLSILGMPKDIYDLAKRGLGYKVDPKSSVGSSEWLIDKAEKAGKWKSDPNAAATNLGRISGSFINPVAATRAVGSAAARAVPGAIKNAAAATNVATDAATAAATTSAKTGTTGTTAATNAATAPAKASQGFIDTLKSGYNTAKNAVANVFKPKSQSAQTGAESNIVAASPEELAAYAATQPAATSATSGMSKGINQAVKYKRKENNQNAAYADMPSTTKQVNKDLTGAPIAGANNSAFSATGTVGAARSQRNAEYARSRAAADTQKALDDMARANKQKTAKAPDKIEQPVPKSVNTVDDGATAAAPRASSVSASPTRVAAAGTAGSKPQGNLGTSLARAAGVGALAGAGGYAGLAAADQGSDAKSSTSSETGSEQQSTKTNGGATSSQAPASAEVQPAAAPVAAPASAAVQQSQQPQQKQPEQQQPATTGNYLQLDPTLHAPNVQGIDVPVATDSSGAPIQTRSDNQIWWENNRTDPFPGEEQAAAAYNAQMNAPNPFANLFGSKKADAVKEQKEQEEPEEINDAEELARIQRLAGLGRKLRGSKQ